MRSQKLLPYLLSLAVLTGLLPQAKTNAAPAPTVSPATDFRQNSSNFIRSVASDPVRSLEAPTSPLPRDSRPPSLQPPVEPTQPTPLPPPDRLLQPEETSPTPASPEPIPVTLVVNRYEVKGSTVFSAAELEAVTRPFTTPVLGHPASFTEMLQARSAVTKLYVDRGYMTSGAIIRPQPIKDGVVVIDVVEGKLEQINVHGTRRLKSGYVSSRLAIATQPPLNQNRLLEALQVLQLDPLIQSISADLQAGTRPGTNILDVKVTEAKTFSLPVTLDNGRSPSVGSFRRQIALNQANLLGNGDSLSIGYTNTDGSNGVDVNYTTPLSPRNTKLSLAFGTTRSRVIEKPFDILDISAKSSYYELSLRHPLVQTPTEELAIGLALSHQSSQTFLGLDDIGAFPLSPGADSKGRTSTTAIRFFQEWSKRSSQQVLALRSQFSLGTSWFGATVNQDGPDSHFFSWRGQGQWVRQLAPDTLFLARADVQLADRPLLGLEQFGLGGQLSVRGYRQDFLLTDNGWLASAEFRIPVLRVPKLHGVLQVTPFIDVGRGWNTNSVSPSPGTLAGTGIGLLWRQGNNLTARLDWGIPLISVKSEGKSWQENGIYFSLTWSPF